MPNLVSQNQSAFVGGRMIQDNIIITHEIVHCLKKRKEPSKDGFIAKLDMNKAYDRLEWKFLEKCLLAFGFCDAWVQMIMRCVTGVSYKYKVNGIPSRKLIPQRGFRQGDPLSLYLFIIAMECLSYLLSEAAANGKLSGLQVTTKTPAVTHLFVANDIILFGKVRDDEAYEMVRILNTFSLASG